MRAKWLSGRCFSFRNILCRCGIFSLEVLTVFMIGILESAVYFSSLMMVTENFAFMAGSSKHGKAARAKVGSNNVAAKYLGRETGKENQ